MKSTKATIVCADCLDWMRSQPSQSVDLTFGSPPYETARTYGISFNLKGQEWVDWMVVRIREMLRITKGLVAMVVEGQTRQYRWSATPALLMADLHRAGITLRKPPIYSRVGIPGSGGPDWLANRYEFIVCCTNGGKLPWSNNTAMGHPPKYPVGGDLSYRLRDGRRRNDRTFKMRDGDGFRRKRYTEPPLSNPGNIINCSVGGGKMGSKRAHESEAPFHERLPEFFIKSFCPEGGVVLDPFVGSGTTAKVALSCGRNAIGVDCREDQCQISKRRINEIQAN